MKQGQMNSHQKPLVLACLLAVTPMVIHAAPVVEPSVPNAGQLMQQAPTLPATQQQTAPSVSVNIPSKINSQDQTPIPVSAIKITGNTVFTNEQLQPLVGDVAGKTLTLGGLSDLAKRITDFYHDNGYLLAQAVVPPQDVTNGVVTIQVVEAQFDKITVNNNSEVNTGLIESTLSDLQKGSVVKQQPVDHDLLLVSDIPGAKVHATLAPGAAAGTTNLTVNVDPVEKMWGQVGVDNEGSKYTGEARATASMGVNDLLHWGDVLNLDGMTTGHGMNWGKISYQGVLNGSGTQAGVSYSALEYHLGRALKAIDGHGTAELASVWLNQPIIRSKVGNLYGKVEYDHRDLDDEIGSVSWFDKRHIDSVTFSLYADETDQLLGGGTTNLNISLTKGDVDFDDEAAKEADAATANTQGGYTIWRGGLNRLQNLTDTTKLYVSYTFQRAADSNVDSAEQFLLGGPGTVRGYRVSTLGGSSGQLETVELRQLINLPIIKMIQASAFFDAGQLNINEHKWTPSTNHANLMSAGLGLDWVSQNRWIAKFIIAKPVGPKPELLGSRPSTQVWLQLTKQF